MRFFLHCILYLEDVFIATCDTVYKADYLLSKISYEFKAIYSLRGDLLATSKYANVAKLRPLSTIMAFMIHPKIL